MDNIFNQENRSNKRQTGAITTIVKGQESTNIFWSEATDLTTVSQTGISFNLNRECKIGRLLSFMLPMPTKLRAYDFETEFYIIWGVVQHCTPISNQEFTGYHIGVAFIGKDAPLGFKKNPLASYRISGLNENGLWKVKEAERAFVVRKYPRFDFKLVVKLTLFDSRGKIFQEINTSTLNISRKGAAVISNFDFTKADKIIFTCTKYFFQSSATICNQPEINKETSILHLEFVEKEFPTRELFPPLKTTETGFEINFRD